ncbi:MAG: SulP family inorganic anion transporter [Puniceicoccales bacterium]
MHPIRRAGHLIRSTGLRPFPLGKTLREYSWAKAKADGKSAINVVFLDFPQGMAYALIAGLPVQMGVFCSALASITGPFLASSRFIMLGPTNATAVMLLSTFLTLGYSQQQAVIAMPILLLMVSAFMIGGALLRVSAITQFVSRAVIVGYITAAACLIIVNQLKTVLGLHVPRAGTFAESLWNLLKGIGGVQWESALIAGTTLAIYVPLKKYVKAIPTVALCLLLSAVVVVLIRPLGIQFEMLSPIDAAAWPLSIPSLHWAQINQLVGPALAVAFLSLLESSSISKALAAQAGDRVDVNQQMLSIGAANFVSALGSGMAVSGSLTRSALNFRSGAATPLSSIFSGALLIIFLFLIGGLIGYIPKASLSMVVIIVGFTLINRPEISVIARTTKSDFAVFLATFIGGLALPLDTAIALGAIISIVLFVRKAARPSLKEITFDDRGNLTPEGIGEKRPEIAIVHVEGDLFFASSDLFLEQMRRLVGHDNQRAIILRLRNARHLDATAALTIIDLIRFARKNNCAFLVSGAHEEIDEIFQRSGLMAELGEENFFRYSVGNPNLSTRDALKRAQQITGVTSADITIFAAEKNDKTPEDH